MAPLEASTETVSLQIAKTYYIHINHITKIQAIQLAKTVSGKQYSITSITLRV